MQYVSFLTDVVSETLQFLCFFSEVPLQRSVSAEASTEHLKLTWWTDQPSCVKGFCLPQLAMVQQLQQKPNIKGQSLLF